MENSTRKVMFFTLDYNVFSSLKTYSELLKSHYSGKYKLIVNSCHNKMVAYHYSVTLNHLEFKHPIFQFMNSLIRGMPCGGNYSGIITSSYLSKLLNFRYQQQISHGTQFELMIRLSKVKETVINSLQAAKREETIECNRLLSMVEWALEPMPLERSFRLSLAIQVVKAVLSAVDENSSKLGHIQLYTVEGKDYCQHFNGVLYRSDSLWSSMDESCLRKRATSCKHRFVLFTESLELAGDCVGAGVSLVRFIECLLNAGVSIVGCQKSIDKRVVHQLRRNNVIALERLGEERSNVLAAISGAVPVADSSLASLKALVRCTGVLSGCRFIAINDESLILLERNASKSVTIFISMRCTDVQDQLKVIVKECIHAVYSIIKNPFFLPEDFDVCLASQLRSFSTDDSVLKNLMTLFADTLETSLPANADQLNQIFLIKRNCLDLAFSVVMNILQVGLFVDK